MEAAMADHLEIEQKFDVDTRFTLPDLSTVPGCAAVSAPVTFHLSATYYDTPGNRLAASKITLRRRTGGPDEGWHLKLPAGSARRELQEPLSPGDEARVPDRLAARVADVTDGLPLAPIALLQTERTVHALLRPAGEVLAEVADDVVIAQRTGTAEGDAAGRALGWREVEVEVPEGTSPEVLKVAAELLLSAGARPAAKGSKLARLLDS
jgi:inorganic triphosphatase YgiF